MPRAELQRREHSAFLRRLAHLGARRGPLWFLKLSPKPIGAAFGLLLPDVRRRMVSNLRRVHGTRSRLREQVDALRTFANYAACLAEALAAGRHDARTKLRVSGEAGLREALACGGVVVVTAHLGPWDATAQLLGSALSADVLIVMEPEPNQAAREFQDRLRGERGVRVLHVGAHPADALPLVSHLRAGGVAALQLDRPPPNGRVIEVSLFGAPFAVPEGPFRLAALSGARIVPVFARRLGHFDYELSIAEPLEVPRKASAHELELAAQRAAEAMAAFIRESPTQWFHFSGSRVEPPRRCRGDGV